MRHAIVSRPTSGSACETKPVRRFTNTSAQKKTSISSSHVSHASRASAENDSRYGNATTMYLA